MFSICTSKMISNSKISYQFGEYTFYITITYHGPSSDTPVILDEQLIRDEKQ